ncbi:MAG: AarF/UbiB family protein [Crocinitomicaceae bacterium]|nr:AarF/UbiB family protein [Crocinitomicaceae bacterium]
MKKRHVRKRLKKANRVTFKVLFSYLFLFLGKRLFGKKYYQKRIEKLHKKNAARIKEAILELKGLFIKVGQLFSVMSHILPDAYSEVMESLQDHAPKTDYKTTAATIEKELGEPISSLFQSFEEEPIASASIGQVHKSQLKTGDWVAVKIQHANIEELAEADLYIIEKIIKRISFFMKINGIEHVYGQVKQMIHEELDYSIEANNMLRISENLEQQEGIIVPKVFSEYSSTKVLVTAWQEGTKITNTEQLDKWNINKSEIAERLILTYCKMIFEDGFYHADPHPGNLLVKKDGTIILLDFGAVAILPEEMRREIPILIQAVVRKDNEAILKSLQKLGFVGSDGDSQAVASQLIDALSNFLLNEVKVDNLNFKDLKLDDVKGSSIDKLRKEISLKELTKTIQVPKDWILFDRTVQLLIGTSHTLAPEVHPLDVVKPYMKRLVIRGGGLKQIIVDALKQQVLAIFSLPAEMDSFLKKANSGGLEVNVRTNNDLMYALGQQVIFTLVGLGCVYFYQKANTPPIKLNLFLIGGIASGLLLMRSMWKNKR